MTVPPLEEEADRPDNLIEFSKRRGGYARMDAEEALAAAFWRLVISDLGGRPSRRVATLAWLHAAEFAWWAELCFGFAPDDLPAFRDRLLVAAGLEPATVPARMTLAVAVS